jgi:NADPH2:quinone reductase
VDAIVIERPGGPEVLEHRQLDDPEPGPGEVVVDVGASGVNFVDTYQRGGLYEVPMPFVPGFEGCGVVTAVGRGVEEVRPGDRVAWVDARGSYATKVVVPAARAIPVPAGIDVETAAAVSLQGVTAQFLVRDTFALRPGHRCLIQAGAGGVGLLLVQMAKLLGAEVFTTVGSIDKADRVRAAGADHVILYREEDFGDAVERIAGPRPLDVVYDGVGRSTFARGLGLLRRRGTMVTFGNASGPVEPVAPLTLMTAGSLYLTRPTLGHYVGSTGELRARADEVYGWVLEDRLQVHVGQRVPLAEAERAHRLLESRATSGKVLLVP